MPLKASQYNPRQFGRDGMNAFFNEVAARVNEREGRDYIAQCAARQGGTMPDEERAQLEDYPRRIAQNFSLTVSGALAGTFGREDAEPDQVRGILQELREGSDGHYEAQKKKGDDLSADDLHFNRHLELYAATHRTFLERLSARLG